MGCVRSKQEDEVSAALQKINDSLDKLRVRHNYLFNEIKSKGKSRQEQRIILVYIKKTVGLQNTLLNVSYAIQQGAIDQQVVAALKSSREALRNMTRQNKTEDIYRLVDDLRDMSEDIEASSSALAELDLDDIDREQLEKELDSLELSSSESQPAFEPIFPSVPAADAEVMEQPLLAS